MASSLQVKLEKIKQCEKELYDRFGLHLGKVWDMKRLEAWSKLYDHLQDLYAEVFPRWKNQKGE